MTETVLCVVMGLQRSVSARVLVATVSPAKTAEPIVALVTRYRFLTKIIV